MSRTKQTHKPDSVPKTDASSHLEYCFEHHVNFKQRIITISEDIDEETFAHIDAALTEMESQSKKPIVLRINSAGGYIYDAAAIVGRMRKSSCPIHTEGYGQVMSAATLILAAGHKRSISSFGWIMYHEASYGISGRHSTVKEHVEQSEREENLWCQWMGKFTRKSEKYWKRTGFKKDAYFTAEEAVQLGIVDSIF